MSEFAQAFQGFAQSGKLAGIIKLATMGANVAGQYGQSRAEAEAIEAAGREEHLKAQAEALQLKREKRCSRL